MTFIDVQCTCGLKAAAARRVHAVDLFDALQQDIFYFDAMGSVLIAGDGNARVGLKPDYKLLFLTV